MIMPIYTDNRVFMGHPGTTPDFDTKKAVGMKILSGQASSDELIQLLKKYRIKYVVFGIENLPFSSRSYVSSPFLKEIYHQENGVSVVEVF